MTTRSTPDSHKTQPPPDAGAATLPWGGYVLCICLLLAGCGTVYVNEADRNPTYRKETSFASILSSEMTYRRIYTMLYGCTSGYYRVQGNYDPKTRHAEISVDTGVGFQNDLYFADSHVMRVVIEPDGTDKSKVRIDQTSREGSPYADAMARWVNESSDEC